MNAVSEGIQRENEDGLRHTALALHAMTAADRAWMLSQLPAHTRADLIALLNELDELGLPKDRTLLSSSVTGMPSTSTLKAAMDSSQAQLIARVAALSPEAVASVLERESAVFGATLMAISTWPWRDQVMQRIGAARARRIAEASMTYAVRPGEARDVAMLEATLACSVIELAEDTRHRVRSAAPVERRASWNVAGLIRSFSRKAQA